MTLHKIDREKLAEALDNCFVHQTIDGDALTVCADSKIDTAQIIKKAAENWLAITDPGFEPSEEMKEAGEGYAYGEYIENAVDGFKAMIATMIKGE